jgi:hypothetical protein
MQSYQMKGIWWCGYVSLDLALGNCCLTSIEAERPHNLPYQVDLQTVRVLFGSLRLWTICFERLAKVIQMCRALQSSDKSTYGLGNPSDDILCYSKRYFCIRRKWKLLAFYRHYMAFWLCTVAAQYSSLQSYWPQERGCSFSTCFSLRICLTWNCNRECQLTIARHAAIYPSTSHWKL